MSLDCGAGLVLGGYGPVEQRMCAVKCGPGGVGDNCAMRVVDWRVEWQQSLCQAQCRGTLCRRSRGFSIGYYL